MTAYLSRIETIADATPEGRNRVVDLWRVIAMLLVVAGHWLAASIWADPNGDLTISNSLEWIPYASWVSWLVQVMPIFFLCGGYANARAVRPVLDGDEATTTWITTRVRRLFTPVVPFLAIWTVIAIVAGLLVSPDLVRTGAHLATMPLWFMAVYLSLTALAPMTMRWWRQSRWVSVATLAVAAVAVDIVRMAGDVTWVGFLNFFFIWAGIHQLGYWWADRDLAKRPVPPRLGAAIALAALAVLIVVTAVGWYPVSMVGLPGGEPANMTPPTMGIGLLAVTQAGVVWWSAGPMQRFAMRRRVWRAAVGVSGVIMSLYLWHLTAMTLVTAVGISLFNGTAFRPAPGSATWWLTRPVWLALLATVTVGLLVAFARFEWRINQGPAPSSKTAIVGGAVLAVASTAVVAWYGLVGPGGGVYWPIPVTAAVSAGLVGAVPQLWGSRRFRLPPKRPLRGTSPDQ